ncbi:hypothetical protein SRABI13_01681 [Erwinia aphidicola]|uniref:lysozyme inhibitor LprI family protein n=1 Tax=Erwinia aphidicola TaxID=68334 RepID=UPI001D5B3E27|nr:lysozyme inhibitor LprI family protein [Erwinia aphidicola]CAH0199052.1 hypothetical protein SRABI13_01681 [Erwinia aphidicola]
MKKLIFPLLVLLPMTSAFALDCNNAQTQLDMNQCASAEYKKSDNELNNTYQQVLKATSGEQTNLLKKSQNKWIEYRDTDCKFQTYSSRGGSINSMNVSHCLTGKTEQRTKELKEMLNCPEGDVSCAL